jgi:hypothetical protein
MKHDFNRLQRRLKTIAPTSKHGIVSGIRTAFDRPSHIKKIAAD